MRLAVIKGYITSTVKHSSLDGARLVIAQPVASDGSPDGAPQVVVDPLGTGLQQKVVITSDGMETREFLKDPKSPARWNVMAIVDPKAGELV